MSENDQLDDHIAESMMDPDHRAAAQADPLGPGRDPFNPHRQPGRVARALWLFWQSRVP